MKEYQKKTLYIAVFLVAFQILSYVFNFSSGLAFLFGTVAILLYLLNEGDVSNREAAAGITGFLLSSFAISSLGKIFFLDGLCEIARPSTEIGSGPSVLNPENFCQGFFEVWIQALTANPVYNWYFWAGALGVAVLSGYIYRLYEE